MGKAGQGGGQRRYARVVASTLITLALVGCGGLGLLPYQNDAQTDGFQSYKAVQTAYREIKPGATLASDLSRLGFDAARSPGVQVLSYLGMIERFMPRSSIRFDKLAPAVQACIDARDRCTAYVFKPQGLHREGAGSLVQDIFGLRQASANTTWAVEVILLVQDGRVAYKAMADHLRG